MADNHLTSKGKLQELIDNLALQQADVDAIEITVDDILNHLNSGARCMGSTAGASPGLTSSLVAWTIVSGDADSKYGAAKEVFNGAEDFDLPVVMDEVHPHEVLVVTTSSDNQIWKLQFANSGYNSITEAHTYASMAEAISAKKYTEATLNFDSRKTNTIPLTFQSGKMKVGSKLWVRLMNNEAAESTLDILICIHGHVA